MKYTMDQYQAALDHARETARDYLEHQKLMEDAREALYQGLEVGDGVTINLWTDRHAGTIVKRTKCRLWIQRDQAIRIDSNGMSEDQDYEFRRDPEGIIYQANWSAKRKTFVWSGNSISVGRHEYYDYSF